MRLDGSAYRITFGFLFFSTVWSSQGASFDCSKARTQMEKLVCSTPSLSAADEALAAAHRNALNAAKGMNAIDLSNLKDHQRDWLKWTAYQCSDAACLTDAYVSQIGLLKAFATPRSLNGWSKSNMTGTYDDNSGTLKVLNLAGNKLQFSFDVFYKDHSGSLFGEMALEGDRATYIDSEDHDCKFAFRFGQSSVYVQQSGMCGSYFGMNVSASGAYILKDKTVPIIQTDDVSSTSAETTASKTLGIATTPLPQSSNKRTGEAHAEESSSTAEMPIPANHVERSSKRSARSTFFALLFLVSLAAMVMAVIKPRIFSFSGGQTGRGKALGYAVCLLVVSLIGHDATHGEPTSNASVDSERNLLGKDNRPQLPAAPVSRQTAEATQAYEASALISEFQANQIRAEQQFKGKTIEIRGKVIEIGKDDDGMAYVGLGNDATDSVVKCSFDESQEAALASYSKGAYVLLKGVVNQWTQLNIGDVGVANRVDIDRCEPIQPRPE